MCGCCWKALSKNVGTSSNDIWITIRGWAWSLPMQIKIKYQGRMGRNTSTMASLHAWKRRADVCSCFWYLWRIMYLSCRDEAVTHPTSLPVQDHCSWTSWFLSGSFSAVASIFVKMLWNVHTPLGPLFCCSQPVPWAQVEIPVSA